MYGIHGGVDSANAVLRDTGYRIQDTAYTIQDTGYRIQDTGYRIPDTVYRIQRLYNVGSIEGYGRENREVKRGKGKITRKGKKTIKCFLERTA